MNARRLHLLLLFVLTTSMASLSRGQPVYDFTHLQVEQAGYQLAEPGAVWGLNGDYLLYLPDEYSSGNDPSPLLLFLHGAGARGSDLTKVSKLPPMVQAENGSRPVPFILLAPQCLPGFQWHPAAVQNELLALLDEVIGSYNVDRDRIYLAGQSMGGKGTWELLADNPDIFAAAVPICGTNTLSTAPLLVDIPIWAFHGRLDRTIVPAASIDMVNAIVTAGGTHARLTIYEEIGHSVWWTVFKRPDIYAWLLSHARGGTPEPSWGEYAVDDSLFVDTGNWLGRILVGEDPWIWRTDSGEWVYFPDSHISSSAGQWVYTPRP